LTVQIKKNELQRCLAHQSQRDINSYTNAPEGIAPGYIEGV